MLGVHSQLSSVSQPLFRPVAVVEVALAGPEPAHAVGARRRGVVERRAGGAAAAVVDVGQQVEALAVAAGEAVLTRLHVGAARDARARVAHRAEPQLASTRQPVHMLVFVSHTVMPPQSASSLQPGSHLPVSGLQYSPMLTQSASTHGGGGSSVVLPVSVHVGVGDTSDGSTVVVGGIGRSSCRW
jgi:hypothetical protein